MKSYDTDREPHEMPQLDHSDWEHEMDEHEREGTEVADFAMEKESLDANSWMGNACRYRLPGGGNHPKGRKR